MAAAGLVVGKDKDAIAAAVVEKVATIALLAIAERGVFNVAVSGGSMPKILAAIADAEGVDWSKWRIFFADERCVPLDDDDSNYKAWTFFFEAAGIPMENIFAIDPSLSPEAAATDYASRLKEALGGASTDGSGQDGVMSIPRFDALLLGMGPDGHTCSLFPGHPLLDEKEKWVAHIEDSPKPPPSRITLTFPVLNEARNVMFVGTGESKASLLPQLIGVGTEGGLKAVGSASPYPAARVYPEKGSLTYCVDTAAAAQCPPEVMALAQAC
ncbi:unnamed protein product [Discosporangium mesarthrocarpum]